MKDALQGPAVRNPFSHRREGVRVAFSPDGTKLAAGLREGQVVVWDLVARQFMVVDAPESPSPILALAYSPDGETLAFSRPDEALSLWEFRTEHKREIGRAHPGGGA